MTSGARLLLPLIYVLVKWKSETSTASLEERQNLVPPRKTRSVNGQWLMIGRHVTHLFNMSKCDLKNDGDYHEYN